ncbi:MAG TPA: molybdate ABC transporter substrate-binding protein [Syntrophales bacterium]|nr:molybdate ABC transporter substrate-binding protein [Syntrophales bacterium]
MKRFSFSLFVLLFALMGSVCPAAAAEKLTVAVAANFILPSGEIVTLFQEKTGITVEPTYSSTGKLYGQIVQGAPYDVFLSADEARPAQLKEQGLADEPFVYARGQVVLWTAKKSLQGAADWQSVVKNPETRKIAIANTESAPYGTAAMTALEAAGLWEALKEKYVFPQTVAQAFQYALTESADAGFCAYSSALSDKAKGGFFYPVPEAPPIVQAACVLKRTENRPAAEKFAAFLDSPEAKEIKEKYGYR